MEWREIRIGLIYKEKGDATSFDNFRDCTILAEEENAEALQGI